MFVLTIDQAGSQHDVDRVPDLLELLRGVDVVTPFERSVGDEAQGIPASAEAAIEAALLCLRQGGWYVGLGIGGIEHPLPASPREGRGSAFVAARTAVERAKKTGDRAPLAVEGPPGAAEAEGVLALIGRHVMHRSRAEWRILDRLQPGKWGSQTAAARELGIAPQSVSKAVARSAWTEEWAARPAAALLLAWADKASDAEPTVDGKAAAGAGRPGDAGHRDTDAPGTPGGNLHGSGGTPTVAGPDSAAAEAEGEGN
ncbi:helix-turn-helix domain-containing protein [Arthrobacter sp. MSA 4-2]|uniref:MarR family transcriptional regulator n=1 Tax=Arthrobacter sp. MSA 4-2 TaxID=2794349 RepID=UPI0027DE9730|nr:helix-turn-helix domain-containing protein [Arthrobacter sp. MSA 4-2]